VHEDALRQPAAARRSDGNVASCDGASVQKGKEMRLKQGSLRRQCLLLGSSEPPLLGQPGGVVPAGTAGLGRLGILQGQQLGPLGQDEGLAEGRLEEVLLEGVVLRVAVRVGGLVRQGPVWQRGWRLGGALPPLVVKEAWLGPQQLVEGVVLRLKPVVFFLRQGYLYLQVHNVVFQLPDGGPVNLGLFLKRSLQVLGCHITQGL
jgi:hypothetical protein